MPSQASRKDAIRQFKERKPFLGIFAVRCTPTSNVWVGSSRNLYAVQNSTWFSLRLGGYYDKSLQQEWNAQGESAFTLEILETLKEDVAPLLILDLLKEKRDSWATQLGARRL